MLNVAHTILEQMFLQNSLRVWAWFFLAMAVCFVVLKYSIFLLKKILVPKETNKTLAEIFRIILGVRSYFLLMVSLYFASSFLSFPPKVDKILHIIFVSAFFLQIASWGNAILLFVINSKLQATEKGDAGKVTTLKGTEFIVRICLYLTVFILALDNLGVNISTLVTGLGIVGIAVALAVQNILGDLFASLTIILDKPFFIGDMIQIDKYTGQVERIGVKTTHLRSLTGEQLVFSNTDLLKSRISNFGRMSERRVLFTFKIDNQTPLEKLAGIANNVKDIIDKTLVTRFERANFKDFSYSTFFEYEVVYWVLASEMNVYMNIQQKINIAILEMLAQEKVALGIPEQKYISRPSV